MYFTLFRFIRLKDLLSFYHGVTSIVYLLHRVTVYTFKQCWMRGSQLHQAYHVQHSRRKVERFDERTMHVLSSGEAAAAVSTAAVSTDSHCRGLHRSFKGICIYFRSQISMKCYVSFNCLLAHFLRYMCFLQKPCEHIQRQSLRRDRNLFREASSVRRIRHEVVVLASIPISTSVWTRRTYESSND